jgi:L-threonylcarbamoyladenylate synthase
MQQMTADNPVPSAKQTLRLSGGLPADITVAANLLREGGTVAIPTETVYGLAASALDTTAVRNIFLAKGRPSWDPLIVHVRDTAMASLLVRSIPDDARKLMDAFWPGPFTLLLPRNSSVPDIITAGRDLVGLRMPAHPVARQLIGEAGLPLAAPSANRFGHISPTTAQHVLNDLDGRIDAVLDAGPSAIGVESTVFDSAALVLYRQGGVSQQQLEDVLKKRITVYQNREETQQKTTPESLPSPGIGMRHYAPSARVILAYSQDDLRSRLHQLPPDQTAVLLPTHWNAGDFSGRTVQWEAWDEPTALARTLYNAMRALEETGAETIVIPLPPLSSNPLTEAIRDRLMKAARDA